MEIFIKGLCDQMCPKNEIKLRINQKLVHFLEKNPETLDADKGRFVKEFARSAAGKKTEARDLRTLRALRQTVRYLLTEIIYDNRKPFHIIYDFIFDRLRAVRQEIVMQNLSPADTLTLIEPMIMFLVYSRYRLCEEPVANFDPKICRNHTMECIQTALVCYDQGESSFSPGELENRHIIESIYILTNLGNSDSLCRGIGYSSNSPIFQNALRMSLHCWQKNYYRALEMWQQMPTVSCVAASECVPEIREKLIATLATAYHSKQLSVPLEWLVRILRYGNRCQLEKYLRQCGVEIINGTDVRFDKVAFEKREKFWFHREPIVEEKLSSHPFSLDIKFTDDSYR